MNRTTEPVAEVPVRLSANGVPLVNWTCSPEAYQALAAGRLLTMGFVRGPGDLLDIQSPRDPADDTAIHRIDARIPPDRLDAGLREREHRREHGCGLRFLLDCRRDLLPQRDDTAIPELDAFAERFRELFDRSPSRRTTGGHHTAALSDGEALLHLHEEIGRHNGVDKALGAALLEERDLRRLGILTTARISGEIAEKAARAGVAWVASRSVPTTMAVAIATAAGLPLIARAAGQGTRVFGAGA
ncbi:MAG: formate dehydrogenase accessory sulfurtransferase FdhD [Gemmatimonadota bacterium]